MQYSIQLYSIRDLAQNDLGAALDKVAQIGYRAVEFAGFFGHSPAEVNAMLARNGLTVSGTHTGLGPLLEDYEGTVAFHKAIGNTRYIIPGHDLSDQEKLDDFVGKVNPLCKKLAAEGITLAFHNHHHEFIPRADGSVAFEQLLYRTDLKFEVDTYWAFVGMKDPLAILRRVGDRLIAVHLKDGDQDGKGMPLGMGDAPVRAVWEAVKDRGIPLVVESETLQPDGATEAKICFDYLQSLGE